VSDQPNGAPPLPQAVSQEYEVRVLFNGVPPTSALAAEGWEVVPAVVVRRPKSRILTASGLPLVGKA
jgi:hypothetical protein